MCVCVCSAVIRASAFVQEGRFQWRLTAVVDHSAKAKVLKWIKRDKGGGANTNCGNVGGGAAIKMLLRILMFQRINSLIIHLQN